MAYYLGIDGGGTKTRFALADETTILARATCGGSNMVRLGETQAGEVLRQGLQQDLHPGCVGAALLGLRVEPGSELIGEVRLSRGGSNGLVWVWDGHKKLASIASQPVA